MEASGIIQSVWDADRFWLHNDSSYPPELFAIRQDGTLLSTVTLETTNRDWEEIARGPCDQDDLEWSCLYVGEIGDNAEQYESIAIHRWREPETLEDEMFVEAEDFETMHLVYPDRPQDAEAMVVDEDQQVWILSKRPPGETRLYMAPFMANDQPAELDFIREMDLADISSSAGDDFVTAADWDPERRIFLMRQYFSFWAFHLPDGDIASLFDTPAVSIPRGLEPQGEAVTWLRSGGYLHVSEGKNARIWRVDLAP